MMIWKTSATGSQGIRICTTTFAWFITNITFKLIGTACYETETNITSVNSALSLEKKRFSLEMVKIIYRKNHLTVAIVIKTFTYKDFNTKIS